MLSVILDLLQGDSKINEMLDNSQAALYGCEETEMSINGKFEAPSYSNFPFE